MKLLLCVRRLGAARTIFLNHFMIFMVMDMDAPTHAAIGGQGKTTEILATVSLPIAAAKYGLRVGVGV